MDRDALEEELERQLNQVTLDDDDEYFPTEEYKRIDIDQLLQTATTSWQPSATWNAFASITAEFDRELFQSLETALDDVRSNYTVLSIAESPKKEAYEVIAPSVMSQIGLEDSVLANETPGLSYCEDHCQPHCDAPCSTHCSSRCIRFMHFQKERELADAALAAQDASFLASAHALLSQVTAEARATIQLTSTQVIDETTRVPPANTSIEDKIDSLSEADTPPVASSLQHLQKACEIEQRATERLVRLEQAHRELEVKEEALRIEVAKLAEQQAEKEARRASGLALAEKKREEHLRLKQAREKNAQEKAQEEIERMLMQSEELMALKWHRETQRRQEEMHRAREISLMAIQDQLAQEWEHDQKVVYAAMKARMAAIEREKELQASENIQMTREEEYQRNIQCVLQRLATEAREKARRLEELAREEARHQEETAKRQADEEKRELERQKLIQAKRALEEKQKQERLELQRQREENARRIQAEEKEKRLQEEVNQQRINEMLAKKKFEEEDSQRRQWFSLKVLKNLVDRVVRRQHERLAMQLMRLEDQRSGLAEKEWKRLESNRWLVAFVYTRWCSQSRKKSHQRRRIALAFHRMWCMYRIKEKRRQVVQCIKVVQCRWRYQCVQKKKKQQVYETHKRKHAELVASARVIQSSWREYSHRQKHARQLHSVQAAAKVQSVFRGFHIRKKLSNALEQAKFVDNDDYDYDEVDLDAFLGGAPEIDEDIIDMEEFEHEADEIPTTKSLGWISDEILQENDKISPPAQPDIEKRDEPIETKEEKSTLYKRMQKAIIQGRKSKKKEKKQDTSQSVTWSTSGKKAKKVNVPSLVDRLRRTTAASR